MLHKYLHLQIKKAVAPRYITYLFCEKIQFLSLRVRKAGRFGDFHGQSC